MSKMLLDFQYYLLYTTYYFSIGYPVLIINHIYNRKLTLWNSESAIVTMCLTLS